MNNTDTSINAIEQTAAELVALTGRKIDASIAGGTLIRGLGAMLIVTFAASVNAYFNNINHGIPMPEYTSYLIAIGFSIPYTIAYAAGRIAKEIKEPTKLILETPHKK